MFRFLPFLKCACFAVMITAGILKAEKTDWHLVDAYNSSDFVFYGKIEKTIPEPNLKPGALGIRTANVGDDAVEPTDIIWPKSKEITFSVIEYFKQPTTQSFAAYLSDTPSDIWIHIENAAGDVFLSKPAAADPVFEDLFAGSEGLFFIRYFIGTDMPVVYQARLGQNGKEDLQLLRIHQKNKGQSLESVYASEIQRQRALAASEQEQALEFEDEYYKILRIRDLDIRRSLLNDLIERMGFQGRWDYYSHKERFLAKHGAHVSDQDVPSGPEFGKEKIWHDASGELTKLDTIQAALQ